MLTRTILLDLLDGRERKAAKDSKRFPASISSDSPITRPSWGGEWTEVLSHAAGAVDLSRSPLPLLESHNRMAVNIGIVENLKITGGKLRGEVVFGSSARAQELAADVADGIVRSLSVGYTIQREERDEKAKRITATRWTPHEVSIVPVPADVSVGIGRSTTMPPPEETTTTPSPEEARAAELEAATRTERERGIEIRKLVRLGKLDERFADDLVGRGLSVDEARERILNEGAARDRARPISNHLSERALLSPLEGVCTSGRDGTITAGDDFTEDFRQAAIDSLLLRSGIRVEKPHAAARDVSPSINDLARICLSRAGKSGASRWLGGEARGPRLLERAMGTGDFSAILAGAFHAAVRNGYESEPSSHRAWVRRSEFSDFRSADRPILSSMPELNLVAEHGEYKDGVLTDEKTAYSVAKYGVIVSLSWEALKNDNLGAFLRVQPGLGQAARRKESDAVYALFALNSGAGPTMQDSVALFHTTHANLVASAAFDAAQLGLGRSLLRKQTALGGGYLSLVPRYLIVPSEKETAAEVILANATRRMTTEKTTPEWIASLELVVEPRLAATGVYLAADGAQIDTFELGLLDENVSGPAIEEEEAFRVDAKRWKVRHAFGVKALDYRGMVKMVVT